MKERINSFDFIRAVCAWIIVIYHFADICITTPQFSNFPFFYAYANGRWGETTIVTIFFMISGASLYYNHSNLGLRDCKKFYWGRFKGIFPMFYMLWLFLYYKQVCGVKNFLYNGNPKYFLLTLFGVDGYMSYRYTPNYYFIGEWFLGALIFVYLFYPLLVWCMKHCKILTTIVLVGGFISLYFTDFFLISKERNLITCLLAFWLGMLFIRYKDFLTKWQLVIPAAVVACIMLFIPLGLDSLVCMQITSIALFLILYFIGTYIMKVKYLNRFISYSAKISYPIFLLQHVVMSEVIHTFDNYALTVFQECLVLIGVFAVIYVFATVLLTLNKALLNTRPFLALNTFFQKS